MRLLEFFVTAQAWASAAAGEHHGPSIHEIWFPLGNFLIFVFLIVRYGLPPLRGFLQSRRDAALALLSESAAKKEQAEALVREYRGRLAALDQEIAALQSALRHDGENEKNKLLNEARLQAAKIKADADFLADQEIKMARQKMREEMAAEAVAAAGDLTRRSLTPADHGRLIDGFIQEIEQTR